jgi:hypothetical protein
MGHLLGAPPHLLEKIPSEGMDNPHSSEQNRARRAFSLTWRTRWNKSGDLALREKFRQTLTNGQTPTANKTVEYGRLWQIGKPCEWRICRPLGRRGQLYRRAALRGIA